MQQLNIILQKIPRPFPDGLGVFVLHRLGSLAVNGCSESVDSLFVRIIYITQFVFYVLPGRFSFASITLWLRDGCTYLC